MMRIASKSVIGLESSNGFERNKATLLGGPFGACLGFTRDSLMGSSFPGSGVCRFQEEPEKQWPVISGQFSVRLRCWFALSMTMMLLADRRN
jgi:hypothetical protein